MAYDEGLAYRIREALEGGPPTVEKKMFGGVGFLIQGNMACGVLNEDLIVRVGAERHAAALAAPHARPFDITGRAMKGWVMVAAEGYESDEALQEWLRQGVATALALPAK